MATKTTTKSKTKASAAKTTKFGAAKGAIDFTAANAKSIVKAMFPAPETNNVRKATAAHDALVDAYLAARDAEKKAAKQKEAAANAICHAIGKDLGLRGDGWQATWDRISGQIDWQRLAADEHIPIEKQETYRKVGSRSLDITLAKKADA